MQSFPLDAYLGRLNLSDVAPGVAGLRAMQEAQMRAIPFENIDPLLGRVPNLAPTALIAKLIHAKRGGYCFEQNALFSMSVSALGFAPRTVLARVRNGAEQGGTRTHQALVVKADGDEWLCDAGFGGHAPLAPVRLGSTATQVAPNGDYRVIHDERRKETVLQRKVGADWSSLYGFDDAPVQVEDLDAANFLCARWRGAPFVENLLVAFQPEGRRIGLFNRALTRGLPPDTQSQILDTPKALQNVLCDEIGLAIDRSTVDQIWTKIEHAPTSR